LEIVGVEIRKRVVQIVLPERIVMGVLEEVEEIIQEGDQEEQGVKIEAEIIEVVQVDLENN
jgi:hypothetical protein